MNTRTKMHALYLCVGLGVFSTMSAPLEASSVEQFYKGGRLEIVVGSGVGGGYDTYARFLSRHIGRFIPGNPTVIVRNMPGAGGITAANFVYRQAPKDGSVITHLQNTLTIDQIVKTPNIAFDMRNFTWIGSMNTLATICVLGPHVKYESAKDLLSREYIVGTTQGAGNSTWLIPAMLNTLAGTKFRIVTGYTSTSNIVLSIERKEVDALCGWGWDSAQVQVGPQIEAGTLKVGLDIGTSQHPDLKRRGVPFVMDIVTAGQNKDVINLLLSPQNYGRPFAAPPGVPSDRIAALRSAFSDTLIDEGFLLEAGKARLEINYMSSDTIKSLVDAALDTPVAIHLKAADVLKSVSDK